MLTPAPAPRHPRGAVASKTNSRLVPYRLMCPVLLFPPPLARPYGMRAAGKERSPRESSPRTWGRWAVPIPECPPLLLQASGCRFPSPLPSHVGRCCSAHTPLLPPSRHPSRVGTQIPLSVFPVPSPAAPRHPYSKATIPQDRPRGLGKTLFPCPHGTLGGLAQAAIDGTASFFILPTSIPQPFPPSQGARSPAGLGCGTAQRFRRCSQRRGRGGC